MSPFVRCAVSTFMLLFLPFFLISQSAVIKGTVRDQVSEIPLIGAHIQVSNVEEHAGAVTDEEGNFKLENLSPGRYTLHITYLGYEPSTLPDLLLTSGKDVVVDVDLEESLTNLEEVVVYAQVEKDKAINEMATISARTFSLEEVTRYSGGRNDASRLVANFAGVAATNDNRNDIVVRGNSPTGILWRLEGVPIPNPNHFSTLGTTGGPVSALNTNLLKNSDFFTSAFPAEYGNALSGVFDVGFRSGNKDHSEFTAQLAAFSGLEAMAEGPIAKKSNASYLISYRYSFVQLVDIIGLNFGTNATPNYQDLSFVFDWGKTKWGTFKIFGIGAKSDIEFIGKEITTADVFSVKDTDAGVTSKIGVIGLKHSIILNENNYLRTTISSSYNRNTYSEFRYTDTTYSAGDLYVKGDDQIPRYTLHSYLNSKYNAALNSRVGITVDAQNLRSQVLSRYDAPDFNQDGIADLLKVRDIDGMLTTIEPYASFKYQPFHRMTIISGLHALIQTFRTKMSLEPRLGINYKIGNKTAVNLGYGLHAQVQPLPVLFLLSPARDNEFLPLNENLGFTKAHHLVLGLDYKPYSEWRIKSEIYYQQLFDVPVEKQPSSFSILNAGADFVFPQVSDLVNSGKGRNYGLELTVEKFFSKGYYGLLTTSLFQSKYQGSDKIWRNTAFNSQYILNVLGGKEWPIRKNWVVTSDFKITYSGGRYVTPVNISESRKLETEVGYSELAFSEQLPDYFRLDLKLGIRLNGQRFSQQFAVDFQNLTNHQNVFTRRYNRVTGEVEAAYQIGFFPDILWRIQF